MVKYSLALSTTLVGTVSSFSMTMDAQSPHSRREILQKTAGFATAIVVPAAANAYAVPDLLYPFEALEPYIDAPTMKIHHDKHHATYVANINKATEGKPEVDILELQLNALEAGPAVRNNGGGHYNHAFFWDEMAPPDKAKNTKPSAELEAMINKSFGSMDEMKTAFEARAAPGALFGSGWVWICLNQKGDELKLVGTPNQDNPLMKGVADEVMFPILGLDVWEHAYYLKYQNRRPEYVSNWWNVVNWDKVSENFDYVKEKKAGVPVRG
jgi:Fe-Mn family superoxide dismutase